MGAILKGLAIVALSIVASMSGDASLPTAAFSISASNPAVDCPVRFSDGYPGEQASWFWDFGDGATSTSRSPVHGYANPGYYPVTLTVRTALGFATASQLLAVTAGDTLRLISAHPFDVTLTATDPRTGAAGPGQVISQNDIYGIFSIPDITGNAGNPEVIVKMVDASGIGQGYWVFYNALTDLHYAMVVKEVATGNTRTYNDAKVGTTVCGKFDTSAFSSTSSAAGLALPSGGAFPSQAQAALAGDTLRLMSSHPFDVTLSATDPRTGAAGQGQVISQNDIYGIFSIPDITGNAGNPEVIVKMVDATGIGQDYWVFYNALTDLHYHVAIREVATGRTKTFDDARIGTTVCGAFDTSGFQVVPTTTPTSSQPTPTPTPTPPSSTTHVVNVGPGGTNAFRDSVSGNSSTTVRVGDTVQWKFQTGTHSATSGQCKDVSDYYNDYTDCTADGRFESGVQSAGASFSWKTTSAGSFQYYCSVHTSMMTGTITVNP